MPSGFIPLIFSAQVWIDRIFSAMSAIDWCISPRVWIVSLMKSVDQRRSGMDLLGVNVAGDCITIRASLTWVVTW